MKKIIKICPHCKEASLRTKDKGLSTEYKYCLGCKVELFKDELDEKIEIVHSYFAEDGKRIFYKDNEVSNAKRIETLRKTLIAKKAKGLSYRDRNTLRQLRK